MSHQVLSILLESLLGAGLGFLLAYLVRRR